MQQFFVFSAIYLMPLYAIILFYCLLNIARSKKKDKPANAEEIVGAIVFALILWTFSASLWINS